MDRSDLLFVESVGVDSVLATVELEEGLPFGLDEADVFTLLKNRKRVTRNSASL
mgnify:CR=1 FL=1